MLVKLQMGQRLVQSLAANHVVSLNLQTTSVHLLIPMSSCTDTVRVVHNLFLN